MPDHEPTSATARATPPSSGSSADERYLVPALIRGLKVLSTLSGERSKLTLSEVAASLGITRSSAYRLLYTLGHLGFLDYDPRAKSYALGPQVLALGYGYLASRDVIDVATPHLVRLRDRTGWSSHLGELHGREVVYLARVATRRSVASMVHVGTRLPAHSTTMGRVLLSGLSDRDIRELYHDEATRPLRFAPYAGIEEFLQRIAADRANGFVAQNSGYEPGVASVAAPIHDMADRMVGAINVSAVAMFTSEAELDGPLRSEVLAAAAAISRDLGRSLDRPLGRPDDGGDQAVAPVRRSAQSN
jgi:DNA-binding IclR family transcriptional regulator